MRGSIALYSEPDSIISVYKRTFPDDTHKLKMKIETRHAEEPDPLELIRYEGDKAWLWKAIPWVDSSSTTNKALQDRIDILSALEKGPMAGSKIVASTNRPKASIYRRLNELQDAGKIEKTGNLYFVSGGIYEDE